MISFAGNGNYIPSVKVYTAAVKAFIHDFPQVKLYTPWNEPDWIYRPALADHPDARRLLLQRARAELPRLHDRRRDVYRPASQLGSWIQAYERGLHYRPWRGRFIPTTTSAATRPRRSAR